MVQLGEEHHTAFDAGVPRQRTAGAYEESPAGDARSTLVLPYQLQNTAIFAVFLLIIFFRPQGMFGRVWERT